MYDARGGKPRGSDSTVLFGVLTIVVVAAAFFGVLFWPTGSGESVTRTIVAENEAGAPNHAVLTMLKDKRTARYIAALERIDPSTSKDLNADAARLIARGGSKDDMAKLLQATWRNDTADNYQRYLARVDVKHINALLDFTQDALGDLSSKRSKWCKAATYENLASKPGTELLDSLINGFEYKSALYNFSMEGNAILFEAIADAKENPKHHGRMTSSDEAAIQGLAMKLMLNPEIMKLSKMSSMSSSGQSDAFRKVNICKLALVAVDAFDSLPNDTKGRLWAEGMRQAKGGDLQRAMGQMGGF